MVDKRFLDDLEGLAEAAALRGSGGEWRQLIETMPHIVWITRPDGWHVHFNKKWLDFTGLTLKESLGFGWNPPFHPDDRGRAAAVWEQATSTGEPYEIEYRLRRHDGVYRWMLGRAMPLRDDTGTIVRWFGTCTDIEGLKRAQAELERSRTLHRLASSMARLGGWSFDLADDHLVWSEEIYDILRYPTGVVPALGDLLAMYPPEHRAQLEAAVDRCASEGSPFDLELTVVDYTGTPLWVRVMGEAHYGPDGAITQLTGALQDLGEQKEAQRQKEVLAQRLTTTLESITDAFFTVDRAWRMTYVNRRSEELLRRSRDELLGQDLWEAFPQAVGSVLDEVYHRAMRTGVSEVIEEYHWEPLDIWLTIHVYPSEQGLAVYFRDVSDQHRDQQTLRRLNEELEEAARLKDDLLSMASHELRTPLTPILGFLEILEVRGDLTADQHQMLKVMSSNAKRMLRLVDDLLVVGRASAGALVSRPQQVSMEETLQGVLKEVGEAVGSVDLAVAGCQAVVDPQHLDQMVMNLLTNAAKYGAPPVSVTAKAAGEGRIVIEVADHGDGVPPDFQEHMWDRFVQKDRGDRRTATGVGFGLSIVKLLAEANDGTVAYRDGSTRGAVFTVELPGTCQPAHTQTRPGSDTGDSTQDRGGARSPAGDTDVSPSPRSADRRLQHQGSPTTVTLSAEALEGSAIGDDVDPEEVVAWATRQLLHIESRDEAAGVVLRVIQRLGGWTTPARLADAHALPLDVSFGLSGPILPVAPPHSIERMHLERHLPAIVEDARRAIDVVGSVSRLQHAASIDPLTGLANRRRIDRLLARGCARAAVVVMDLDGFKQVNDREGHAAGDRILQHFGSCLQEEIRAGDHAGRLGGDEFIAILQDTDETAARRFVERLRQAWRLVREHQVGLSAGITEVAATETAADAVARADAAMYADKATHHTDDGKR